MNNDGDLFEELVDIIDGKFDAGETSYSEVIGTLSTLKTVYKAQWKAICTETADESNECECDEMEDVAKLQ